MNRKGVLDGLAIKICMSYVVVLGRPVVEYVYGWSGHLYVNLIAVCSSVGRGPGVTTDTTEMEGSIHNASNTATHLRLARYSCSYRLCKIS